MAAFDPTIHLLLSDIAFDGLVDQTCIRVCQHASARNGVPDHLIKELGRWSSNAYQTYIRTPTEALASLSTRLSTFSEQENL